MRTLTRGLFQVGLGYRGALHDALLGVGPAAIDFLEVAPENLMRVGGARRARFDAVAARWPILSHGLSLSIAGPAPLDAENLDCIAAFVAAHGAPWHSDHLAVTSDAATQVHDLLPPLMTLADAKRVGRRARDAQSRLGVPFAVENISAYGHRPGDTLAEADYVAQVVDSADGWLLLDVNNLLVNAANGLALGRDAGLERAFERAALALERLPLERVLQIHIAGHDVRGDGLRIDTHGEAVSAAAFALLAVALARTGPVPVLLERDHNFDDGIAPLLAEMEQIRGVGRRVLGPEGPRPHVEDLYDVPHRTDSADDDCRDDGVDSLVAAVVALEEVPSALILVPSDRLEVYRSLVHGNLYGVVANALPQTAQLLGEDAFQALVRRFVAEVGPQHPWFREVPGDFVVWAEEMGLPHAKLMQWEWLELVAMRDPTDVAAWATATETPEISVNPTMQALVGTTDLDLLGGHVGEAAPEEAVDAVYLVWRSITDEPVFQRVDPLVGQALALVAAEEGGLDSVAAALATHHGLDPAAVTVHLGTQLRALAARGGVQFRTEAAHDVDATTMQSELS